MSSKPPHTTPNNDALQVSDDVRETGGLGDAMRNLTTSGQTRGLATQPIQHNGLLAAAERIRTITQPTRGFLASQTDHAPPQPRSPSREAIVAPADLGRLIRERRLAQGLTQQDLADAAGTGRRFVSELEAGKATLEFGKVLIVCAALGLDIFAAPR